MDIRNLKRKPNKNEIEQFVEEECSCLEEDGNKAEICYFFDGKRINVTVVADFSDEDYPGYIIALYHDGRLIQYDVDIMEEELQETIEEIIEK